MTRSLTNPTHAMPPLVIIGGGNMGRAIVAGGRGTIGPLHHTTIIVAEPDVSKHEPFREFNVRTVANLADAMVAARAVETDVNHAQILIAVKPQMLGAVAAELRPLLAGEQRIVISILAGTPSAKVHAALGGNVRVIRAMPNLPAKIRQSTTAVAIGAGAMIGDESFARELFQSLGPLVVTIDESLMDAFTAVAGSGPAYVFYLAEAMTTAALELGFDEPTARDIVRETIAGAGNLLAEEFQAPEILRANVTSKGGTTEAACRKLDEAGVMRALVEAIRAARDRGRELAK